MKALKTLFLAALLAVTPRLLAHCDTLDGPVVAAGRAALAKGDPAPALAWVHPDGEAELRAAFQQALAARAASPAARELADRWFLETLVRVHRAGEGAPYNGLKPAGALPPAIAAADLALRDGSSDALVKLLVERVAAGTRARFARAAELQKASTRGVEQGRRYVEAYVELIHSVEAIEQAAGAEQAPASVQEHRHAN